VQSGVSIIMISSELPEILAMSDRIVCMCEGQVTGILTHAEATPEQVMRYCTAQHASLTSLPTSLSTGAGVAA
jgi:ABC-type sugar transport system ATPase subunit